MFGRLPRGRPRQRVNVSPALLLLLGQIWQRYDELPVKPPVTFGLVGLLVAVHAVPQLAMPYSLEGVCLSSKAVAGAILGGRYDEAFRRVAYSAVTHADDLHLYYNVSSLLVKGVLLEQRLGSETFAAFCAYAVLASAFIYVVVGELTEPLFDASCAVGFSAVLFAMKVVLDHGLPPDAQASVWGVRVTARYAAWIEIVLASYVNPRASFLGHAAGVLAGFLWLYGHPERWRATNRRRRTTSASAASESSSSSSRGGGEEAPNFFPGRRRPRYTYASGQTGGPTTGRPSHPYAEPPPTQPQADLRRRRINRLDL
mmetsp:Transcript_14195/g.46342  ORF Transcript_14195/g.46342 Transcript_14195/m.46342 type:complete len:314 (+) Transcript_14195:120-1061(+)